jgi:16S rRNA (cytidine1402-2'-O)-methyltransferase
MESEKQRSFEQLPIEEHVLMYEQQGMDRKEAMKCAAKDRGITKREVYQYLINVKK